MAMAFLADRFLVRGRAMRVALGAAVIAASIVSAPALADGGAARRGDVPLPSTTINLIGMGTQSGVAIVPNFRLRLDSGIIPAERHRIETQGSEQSALRKRFSSSMIDYYPLGEGFRLSLGGRLDNRNKGARSAGGLANTLLYAPKAMRGRNGMQSFKKFSPAMTAGFGESIGKNMTIGFEAGALIARNDPMTREFVRFARMGSRNDQRFDIGGGSRINPVAQVSFAIKL